MLFQTMGDQANPAVLFFHAMGVTGASSEPVARHLSKRFYCIMPTATVYCEGQKYISRQDEIRQVETYLKGEGIQSLALVVASSLGADLATAFLAQTDVPVAHVLFDGGQFSQISLGLRRMMTPILYFAIKSLYWSRGGTLKKIMWCDDDAIKPYFIAAGKALKYGNLRRHVACSMEKKPYLPLPDTLQKHSFWSFGSIEEHFQYREALMKAYPHGHFPVFEQHNHMQFQIRNPKGFADMLMSIVDCNALPELPFLRREK